jgi:hypothetical protein
VLHLIWGGAAVHRCGNYPILNKALTAEVVAFAQKRLFPQAVQPCRKHRIYIAAFQPAEKLLQMRIAHNDLFFCLH